MSTVYSDSFKTHTQSAIDDKQPGLGLGGSKNTAQCFSLTGCSKTNFG